MDNRPWGYLGDCAEFQEGYVNPPQSRHEFFDGPIKWLRAVDLNNGFVFETSRTLSEAGFNSAGKSAYLFPPNSLAISKSGTIGRVGILKDWMCGNRAVINIRPNPEVVDSRYVFYSLLAGKEQIDLLAEGSVQRNLYVSQLSKLKIRLPPIGEQKVIAELLGTLDDKIELNRQMNETVEALARAIFKDWFVVFGPTRAKVEGRSPYLAQELWDLFPDALDDDDKPLGWKFGSPLDIATLISGGTPKTSEASFWDGGIPWASAKDVSQCSEAFLLSTERTISQQGLERSSTKLIPALSSVVVARGATTGRLCMFGDTMAMNQTCYALRSQGDEHFFTYCWFRNIISDLVFAAHGSVFDTITTKTFREATVLLPPKDLRIAFEDQVAPLFGKALANLQESHTLSEIRYLLLPKLMSGKIRLGKAKKAVEVVA